MNLVLDILAVHFVYLILVFSQIKITIGYSLPSGIALMAGNQSSPFQLLGIKVNDEKSSVTYVHKKDRYYLVRMFELNTAANQTKVAFYT